MRRLKGGFRWFYLRRKPICKLSGYLRLWCCRLTLPVPLPHVRPTSRSHIFFRKNNRASVWVPSHWVFLLRHPLLWSHRRCQRKPPLRLIWADAPKEFHLFRKQQCKNVAWPRQIKDTYLKWLQQMEAVHLICLSFLACQSRKDSKRTIVFIQLEKKHLLLLMDCNSWLRTGLFHQEVTCITFTI